MAAWLGFELETDEKVLRREENAVCRGIVDEKPVEALGMLTLTNRRLVFAEAKERPRKRGLFGSRVAQEASRPPLVDIKLRRILRARVEPRMPSPPNLASGDTVAAGVESVIVTFITPFGAEALSFQVGDNAGWCNLIATVAGTPLEEIARQPPAAKEVERPPGLRHCPQCGLELEASYKFCWRCGAPQPPPNR